MEPTNKPSKKRKPPDEPNWRTGKRRDSEDNIVKTLELTVKIGRKEWLILYSVEAGCIRSEAGNGSFCAECHPQMDMIYTKRTEEIRIFVADDFEAVKAKAQDYVSEVIKENTFIGPTHLIERDR